MEALYVVLQNTLSYVWRVNDRFEPVASDGSQARSSLVNFSPIVDTWPRDVITENASVNKLEGSSCGQNARPVGGGDLHHTANRAINTSPRDMGYGKNIIQNDSSQVGSTAFDYKLT